MNIGKKYIFKPIYYKKINYDIYFIQFSPFNNSYNEQTISSVEYVKQVSILYPEIKPLLRVLKRLLQIRNMNSCFNGMIK